MDYSMYNSVFSDAITSLDSIINKNRDVSKTDYENFCKDFLFDKLKGKSFGQAFCERFDFNNLLLKHLSDATAKYHIETLGYVSEK